MSNNAITAVGDSSVSREVILSELEASRIYLLSHINTKFDVLKAKVENGEPVEGELSVLEIIYPLGVNSALFKGTKPTAIYFGSVVSPVTIANLLPAATPTYDEVITVKSWRAVYTLILQRCAAISQNYNTLLSLRNKISGRGRVFLSGKPDGMSVPVKIAEELFAEAYFDTEWLIRVLTNDILDVVGYDYSGISVSAVPNKRCQKYGRRYR